MSGDDIKDGDASPIPDQDAAASPQSQPSLTPHQVARLIRVQSILRKRQAEQSLARRRRMHAKRSNIVAELVKTERTYVSTLGQIVDCFLRPLRTADFVASGLVSMDNVKTMFPSTLEMLFQCHSQFLTSLDKRMLEWKPHSCVGDVVFDMMAYLKVYTAYVAAFEHAVKVIRQHERDIPEFKAFVDHAFAHVIKDTTMNLPTLLITPVQRIPRYLMLLTDLRMNTWKSHMDYANICKCCDEVESIVQYVEDRAQRAENVEKVMAVQESLVGKFDSLVAPQRRYVKEGLLNVMCKSKWKPRKLFLFTDIIVWAVPFDDRRSKRRSGVSSRKSGRGSTNFGGPGAGSPEGTPSPIAAKAAKQRQLYQYKGTTRLANCRVTGLMGSDDMPHQFSIRGANSSVIKLGVNTKTERADWMQALHHVMATRHRNESARQELVRSRVSLVREALLGAGEDGASTASSGPDDDDDATNGDDQSEIVPSFFHPDDDDDDSDSDASDCTLTATTTDDEADDNGTEDTESSSQVDLSRSMPSVQYYCKSSGESESFEVSPRKKKHPSTGNGSSTNGDTASVSRRRPRFGTRRRIRREASRDAFIATVSDNSVPIPTVISPRTQVSFDADQVPDGFSAAISFGTLCPGRVTRSWKGDRSVPDTVAVRKGDSVVVVGKAVFGTRQVPMYYGTAAKRGTGWLPCSHVNITFGFTESYQRQKKRSVFSSFRAKRRSARLESSSSSRIASLGLSPNDKGVLSRHSVMGSMTDRSHLYTDGSGEDGHSSGAIQQRMVKASLAALKEDLDAGRVTRAEHDQLAWDVVQGAHSATAKNRSRAGTTMSWDVPASPRGSLEIKGSPTVRRLYSDNAFASRRALDEEPSAEGSNDEAVTLKALEEEEEEAEVDASTTCSGDGNGVAGGDTDAEGTSEKTTAVRDVDVVAA